MDWFRRMANWPRGIFSRRIVFTENGVSRVLEGEEADRVSEQLDKTVEAMDDAFKAMDNAFNATKGRR